MSLKSSHLVKVVLSASSLTLGLCAPLIVGASPANAATSLLQRRPGLQVVTGANLPMALELLMLRDTAEAPELAKIAFERGRDAIKDAGAVVREAYAHVQAEKQAGEAR